MQRDRGHLLTTMTTMPKSNSMAVPKSRHPIRVLSHTHIIISRVKLQTVKVLRRKLQHHHLRQVVVKLIKMWPRKELKEAEDTKTDKQDANGAQVTMTMTHLVIRRWFSYHHRLDSTERSQDVDL